MLKNLALILFIITAVATEFTRADDTSTEAPTLVVVQTKTPEDDRAKIEEYNQACQVIDALLVKKQFKVDCFSNYQHYGPTSKSAKSSPGQVRIAGYNLLHPGTSKSLFKDYSLIAKIMNKFDVVSGLEILGVVGHDKVNNEAVLALLRGSPKMVADLKALKGKTTDLKKLKEVEVKLAKLIADTQTAYSLYRGPGYYKVLMALKKLDPSWALILSPRGDSALQGSAEEMVGFFYRANAVSPVSNPHCNEYKDEDGGVPYACIINVGTKFMGKDLTHNFARRPFMGSFRSGAMKFSLVSMHVVFTFSGDEAAEKKLMNDVFGVDSATELGTGINSSNFARFAEMKMTLDFMNRFKNKYKDNNIMLVSDTNINANNMFWPEVVKSLPGASVLLDEPSTVSPPRYSSDGKETFGVASTYDHFVFDKAAFPGCDEGKVYNYYNSDIQNDVEKLYLIRPRDTSPPNTNKLSPRSITNTLMRGFKTVIDQTIVDGDIPPEDDPIPTKFDYPLSSAGRAKMEKLVNAYDAELRSLLTVKKNEVVADDFQIQERIDGFKRRVFTNQLTNAFYYRFYQEILSDHFPVSINCKN